MRSLLDVNMLIALLDENHVRHADAAVWLDDHIADGWASCPLTQKGCVRILSQPSYPNALGIVDAIGLLSEAKTVRQHQFVADDASILDAALIDGE